MKMKIHKIKTGGREYEFWYDSQYRSWYAAEVDEFGNLGESIDDYTKEGILHSIRMGGVPVIHKYEK